MQLEVQIAMQSHAICIQTPSDVAAESQRCGTLSNHNRSLVASPPCRSFCLGLSQAIQGISQEIPGHHREKAKHLRNIQEHFS